MTFALRLIQLLLRHRVATALVLLASIAVSAYAARTIEIRFQYKDLYDYAGNPRLPLLTRYTEEFGDPGGFVVLLIESDDVFQPAVLRYVGAVTHELESRGEFEQVRSLTNARAIRAVDDAVESGPIVHDIPETPEEVERVRATALGSSLLVRRLIAPDSSATAVLAEMKEAAAFTSVAQQQAAIDAVTRAMQQFAPPAGTHVRVTGAPAVEVETTRALVDDQRLLTPLVLLVLVVALGLTFRSIHGILLPLAAVTVSLLWTGGIFSLLHHPIDLVGSTIPTTLLVYGVVDPIFVYTRYLDKLSLSHTPEEAILESMRELLLPCFVTSLTTALGFAAFITATLPMIKYFGLVVAVGVLFSFVTTVTVLPLLLVSVAPARKQLAKPWIAGVTDGFMAWLWRMARTFPGGMVVGALCLLIMGAGAARGMPIVTEYVGTLPKGNVQDSVRLLERKLSGVVRVAVYLEGGEDAMKRPEVLHAIEAIDRVAEEQPNVTSSISLADLLAETNQAFMDGDPKERHVPDDSSLISQYLALIDPGDLSDFVNNDYSHSHLRILVSDRGGQALWELRDVLQREIDARLPALGIEASLTGHGVVSYYDADNVVIEILWGFVVAFAIIIVVQLVMFRSLRIALISVVPNAVPICACLLVMRAIGLRMRVDNSLVLCVSVGGLFNTTIHIVARIMQQLRDGATDRDAIVGRALAAVGPPSLYTATILSLGFAVMAASRFPGLQVLGLLCLVTWMSGFVADATLTTSFFRVFFNWDSVRLTQTAPREAVLSVGADKEALP
jgi:uncharacterized protein